MLGANDGIAVSMLRLVALGALAAYAGGASTTIGAARVATWGRARTRR